MEDANQENEKKDGKDQDANKERDLWPSFRVLVEILCT